MIKTYEIIISHPIKKFYGANLLADRKNINITMITNPRELPQLCNIHIKQHELETEIQIQKAFLSKDRKKIEIEINYQSDIHFKNVFRFDFDSNSKIEYTRDRRDQAFII
jgi:hypothetical protein